MLFLVIYVLSAVGILCYAAMDIRAGQPVNMIVATIIALVPIVNTVLVIGLPIIASMLKNVGKK